MRLKHLLTLTLLPLLSSIAFAGLVWTPADQFGTVEVTVNADESGFATGVMSLARFSTNDVEAIGCGTRFYDGGFIWGFCQATDSDGVHVVCLTFDPIFVDGISGINPYSFILFEWNSDGDCTRIGFSTQSFQIPDFKKTK